MPRKRKTRAAEASSEPEPAPVQPDVPQLPHGDLMDPVLLTLDQEIVVEVAAGEEQVLEQDVEGSDSEEEEEEEEEKEEEEEEEKEEGEGDEEGDEVVPVSAEGINVGDAGILKEEERNDVNPLLVNGAQKLEFEDELEEEPLEKLLEPFTKDQLVLLFKEAAAKHPDITEKLLELAGSDPAHCKVFVHGLGWDANAETLTSVFGKYGVIEDCKVVRDKNTGKSKGYGFILFKHRDGARRALKQPQKLIEGRMTSCQLASAGPVQSSPAPPMPTFPSPNASEYTQRKIYVSNVSAELDPNKLYEYFSRFGEIEEGPLGLDKQTGKPKGFCLFVYKTFEGAKRALEEPHKNFEGQMLHCQKAIDGPKYNRAHFNQPIQHQGHQGFHHPAKKGRYGGGIGVGHTASHLMASGAGPAVPTMGFNPAVAPVAIGQAVAALLASQGAGLGIGNVLGGIGPGVAPQGVPQMISNPAYGSQAGAGGYVSQVGMQGGYSTQPQIGPGVVRPHQGGAPYMGHGH